MKTVPQIRIRAANTKPLRPSGGYVLYWMIANRRLHYNFSLDRALEHCAAFRKSLLIFEPLRAGYRWASQRLHRFVLDGMADNARACVHHNVSYLPYVEPADGVGKGLLTALSRDACVVVTDDFPCFFLPGMIASAAAQLPVLLEAVDSNGLLPIRALDHASQRAFDFRRVLQKQLPGHLEHFPKAEPFEGADLLPSRAIPTGILARWPKALPELLAGMDNLLGQLPIDQSVSPIALRGGSAAASAKLDAFLGGRFPKYLERRDHPDHDASSGLSPYLHFGHLSAHEVFARIAAHERWHARKLALRAAGTREGWWNMSAAAEAFLDQLITWRELGYNFAAHRRDYDQYGSLPDWARKTLRAHARDPREHLYSLCDFESARTHDALWNAAQTQLLREGTIHNYLRMLWGKKILEWTRTPEEALEIMIHLNNKYALDGRDPNSYSGIFWTLGRYDRPWPERPVFGAVRYMSSANTARKLSVKNYLRQYAPGSSGEIAHALPLFRSRT